jgi:transmembrane sensor
MAPDQEHITYLFRRYLDDVATQEEMGELFSYIRRAEEHGPLKAEIIGIFEDVRMEEGFEHVQWDAMFSGIVNKSVIEQVSTQGRLRRIKVWTRVAAAAVLIALAGGGFLWVWKGKPGGQSVAVTSVLPRDILPGKNGAVLTLAGGQQIVLDSSARGAIGIQGCATITNTNGLLAYSTLQEKPAAILYNTLTTPRGNQYQLVLPDGTKVWLNAASSITYPTVFAGNERSVSITGEAYFEVAKASNRPFRVKINETTEVEVLGTHFNVNAYADEPSINTTLLEGSIKVKVGSKMRILVPGQQARVNSTGATVKLVKDADVEEVVAWKNGLFSFKDANLETVMRQLSRWYNIDVRYEGDIPARAFNGKIGKTLTLNQLLKGLAKTRIKYRIEDGNKITIIP